LYRDLLENYGGIRLELSEPTLCPNQSKTSAATAAFEHYCIRVLEKAASIRLEQPGQGLLEEEPETGIATRVSNPDSCEALMLITVAPVLVFVLALQRHVSGEIRTPKL
jgi:hypothetical protein